MKFRIKTRLKTYFITGLLTVLPIIVTIVAVKFLFQLIENILPYSVLLKDIPGRGVLSPLLSLTVAIISILLVGLITTNVLGRRFISLGEILLTKVPLVSNIYNGVKSLLEGLIKSKESFAKVVLVEYPRSGIYSIGFLTCNTKGEVGSTTPESKVNVFIPTTPNPTSGMLIIVPKDQVTPLNLTVEEGIKLVISGGILTP
ncbi:MAG: DUF502 domain-containing protein [bacterium]|nr:DUF502 domain-containing protein [bacterium]